MIVAEIKENEDSSSDAEEEEWTPSLENVEHVPLIFDVISPEESLKRSNIYYELMNKRRTVRHFSDRDVPVEILHNCIKTAGTHLEIYFLSVASCIKEKSTNSLRFKNR